MFVAKVSDLGISGKCAQEALHEVGILSNMNLIPGDSRSVLSCSGLRLGAPELVTRGVTEDETAALAQALVAFLRSMETRATPSSQLAFTRRRLQNLVRQIAAAHPVHSSVQQAIEIARRGKKAFFSNLASLLSERLSMASADRIAQHERA